MPAKAETPSAETTAEVFQLFPDDQPVNTFVADVTPLYSMTRAQLIAAAAQQHQTLVQTMMENSDLKIEREALRAEVQSLLRRPDPDKVPRLEGHLPEFRYLTTWAGVWCVLVMVGAAIYLL